MVLKYIVLIAIFWALGGILGHMIYLNNFNLISLLEDGVNNGPNSNI
jgi:hypothetical protein